MLFIRWLFFNHPILRFFLSSAFPLMLLAFPWLSPEVERWVGFIALGFVQSIAAGLVGAGLVLLGSAPFYLIHSRASEKLNRRQRLLSDGVFVSKILWPHRIVSFSLVLGCYFYFHDLTNFESAIVFILTLVQFINYFLKIDSITESLDFLYFVESGVILVVSAALGLVLSMYGLLLFTEPSETPSWNPMDERGLRFLVLFCAAIQAFYQIYLTRKLEKTASILKASNN